MQPGLHCRELTAQYRVQGGLATSCLGLPPQAGSLPLSGGLTSADATPTCRTTPRSSDGQAPPDPTRTRSAALIPSGSPSGPATRIRCNPPNTGGYTALSGSDYRTVRPAALWTHPPTGPACALPAHHERPVETGFALAGGERPLPAHRRHVPGAYCSVKVGHLEGERWMLTIGDARRFFPHNLAAAPCLFRTSEWHFLWAGARESSATRKV